MRAYDLIFKKREGREHTPEEITWLVDQFVKGHISDAQVSAWCMAVYYRGLSPDEMSALTEAMIGSGDVVSLHDIDGVKVDKHSTGGVGDKTTLVLAPMVASLGLPVAKMSGRGLGHTGGTLDKLESFSGLTVELDRPRFARQVAEIGIAVAGQTANLVPADKKLYALRDETATVENIGLIASSIMSKKLAAGADAIVLDVKTGSGAFMKTPSDARNLAEAMVHIGNAAGRKTRAVISSMDQPLGRAVGNAIEVREAIDTLNGKGPSDLLELCLTLGSHMVVLGGVTSSTEAARERLSHSISDGSALAKLRELVKAQGGDARMVDEPDRLPSAVLTRDWCSPSAGYVAAIDALSVGLTAMRLGAGRERKDDIIDHGVGLLIRKRIGDRVNPGDPLITLYANDQRRLQAAFDGLDGAVTIQEQAPSDLPPLIYEVVD